MREGSVGIGRAAGVGAALHASSGVPVNSARPTQRVRVLLRNARRFTPPPPHPRGRQETRVTRATVVAPGMAPTPGIASRFASVRAAARLDARGSGAARPDSEHRLTANARQTRAPSVTARTDLGVLRLQDAGRRGDRAAAPRGTGRAAPPPPRALLGSSLRPVGRLADAAYDTRGRTDGVFQPAGRVDGVGLAVR